MNTILDYLIRVRGGQQGQRELKKLAGGLNTFTGRLQAVTALALVAGPALLSLASSATAAGAAAGIVGAAGLVAMAVSLGGIVAVGKTALDQIKKVKTAQDSYNLAIEQYGPASDQATQARERFNAVLAQNGGERTLALLNDLNSLTEKFTKSTEPARVAMTRTFGQGIGLALKLMPAFTAQTNLAAEALRRGLTNSFRQLGGREMRSNITAFGSAGTASIQPILHGLTDLAFAILRLLRPALKYVVQVAVAFQSWAHGMRAASSDGDRMQRIVDGLVGHFKAWWGLLVAVGRLVAVLFKGSADSGRDLVGWLTQIVKQTTAWLDNAQRTGAMKRYFDENADAVKAILSAVAPLAVAVGALASAAMPALTSAGGAAGGVFSLLLLRMQALTGVIRWLGPAAGPMLVAFLAWRGVVIGIGIAQAIWNAALIVWGGLVKAAAAAQWLWNAAMSANPIGLIIVGIAALIAVIVVLVKHWDWVKRAAQNAWTWIKDNWAQLLPLLAGPFSSLVGVIVRNFGAIKDAFRSALNWIIERWNGLEFTVPTLKIHGHNVIPGGGSKIGAPDIPLLAEGGNVRQRGAVVVGDAGPEVLDLPAGARVTPLDQAGGGWPRGDIVIKLGRGAGREIARATRDDVIGGMARG